jgi:hypothetical protein
MSLKATKEAVDALRDGANESCGRGDGCWACQDMDTTAKASVELATLEKAADTLGVFGWLTIIEEKGGKAEREAVAVLKTIAKEAK